jgi:hypothetical protein
MVERCDRLHIVHYLPPPFWLEIDHSVCIGLDPIWERYIRMHGRDEGIGQTDSRRRNTLSWRLCVI